MQPLVRALLDPDEAAARTLAGTFLARSGSRADVFADLLQPALGVLHDLWYQGRIGSADELRCARLASALADGLAPTPARHPVPPGSSCLLHVLAGEEHTFGRRMLAMALEDDGWTVTVSNGEAPTRTDGGLRRFRFVGFSSGYLPARSELAQSVARVRASGVPVLVGGAAFNRAPDLWQRIGATAQGADARVATVLARRVLRISNRPPLQEFV